jgi:hypothetical protein
VRSVDYLGEKHPVAPKRAVVVPVARLPLNGRAARHKFKLLAGVRWTVESPKDAGVSMQEGHHEHGFFKMSCEDFPKAAMNLKFISDTIDRLVEEANDVRSPIFAHADAHAEFVRRRKRASRTSLWTPVTWTLGRGKRRREPMVASVAGLPSMISRRSGFRPPRPVPYDMPELIVLHGPVFRLDHVHSLTSNDHHGWDATPPRRGSTSMHVCLRRRRDPR